MPKVTIHVPDDVNERMEREVSRRGTSRSGLWVEGARTILADVTQRSTFYEKARRVIESESFRRYQERSLADYEASRARDLLPSTDDDIEAPEHLR